MQREKRTARIETADNGYAVMTSVCAETPDGEDRYAHEIEETLVFFTIAEVLKWADGFFTDIKKPGT